MALVSQCKKVQTFPKLLLSHVKSNSTSHTNFPLNLYMGKCKSIQSLLSVLFLNPQTFVFSFMF